MLNFEDLRIAYAPYDESLNRPADRRRFCYYAKKRNLTFEFANPSEAYDLVVVSAGADISVWSRYRRGKVVYDMTDSYLATPKLDAMGMFRGVAKYATRQNRYLLWNYAEGLRQMCGRADAVVCTTAEQRTDILAHCGNVHIILDFQGNVVRSTKSDYSAGNVINLVWEGLAGNFHTLFEVKDVLSELHKTRPIAIHAITNLSYGKYLNGQFVQRSTSDLARKMSVPCHLYEWNEYTCSAIACACDLAIIPIPLRDPIYAGKPDNKLHLFWRMGLPTIVSATPAYIRAMNESEISMACSTPQDWRDVLEKYCSSENARRDSGQRGREFVNKYHSEESMLSRWDRVLLSIFSPATAQLTLLSACEATSR
jgi:hypothetical protein